MASAPHARIMRSIWTNEDWLDLSLEGQWLYERLLTHQKVSLAGVVEWRPKALTQSAKNVTLEIILAAAAELAEARFVIFDESTDEALIRSFVRNDGMMSQPNMATAVANCYAGTGSRGLRAVIVFELLRLKEDQPGLRWDRLADVLNKPALDPQTTLLSVA
jgi:hypothetical protein